MSYLPEIGNNGLHDSYGCPVPEKSLQASMLAGGVSRKAAYDAFMQVVRQTPPVEIDRRSQILHIRTFGHQVLPQDVRESFGLVVPEKWHARLNLSQTEGSQRWHKHPGEAEILTVFAFDAPAQLLTPADRVDIPVGEVTFLRIGPDVPHVLAFDGCGTAFNPRTPAVLAKRILEKAEGNGNGNHTAKQVTARRLPLIFTDVNNNPWVLNWAGESTGIIIPQMSMVLAVRMAPNHFGEVEVAISGNDPEEYHVPDHTLIARTVL